MSHTSNAILVLLTIGHLLLSEASLDADVKNLSSRLTSLSDLQKQTMDLETRSAAVMADILSKLAVNELRFNTLEKQQNSTLQGMQLLQQEHDASVKELRATRNEIERLKQNQNSASLELQQLKKDHNVTVTELEVARNERKHVENELAALTARFRSLELDQNSTSRNLQMARKETKDVQSDFQTTKSKLRDLENDQNSTRLELKSALIERNHFADELLTSEAKLVDMEQNQNMTLQELQQLTQEHALTATDLQTSRNQVNILQIEMKNLEQTQNTTWQEMQQIIRRNNMIASQFQQSQTQINSLQIEISTSKTNLSKELQHIAKLESEITSPSKIAALIRDVSNVENQIMYLQHNVSGSLTKDHSPKIYFEAQTTSSSTTIRGNERLRFNTVALNQGNAYDKSSGVFKAPVSGLYAFWINVRHDSDHMDIGLFTDGIQLYREDGDIGRTSFTCITKVDKGQKIWFTKTDQYSSVLSAVSRSFYGGVLLTAV